MANLLKNPSFEGGWCRDTWTDVEYGEIFVPEGWIAFWKEGGLLNPADPNTTYSRPEMQVINKEAPFLNPPRILDGYRALKYFTFYRVHDAGVMQHVSVVPGQKFRLTAGAHAWFWATDDDDAHISDPFKSGYWKENIWYDFPNGHEGFDFLLGIDPLGGSDPYAASVVWSSPSRYYDEYLLLPGLEVKAEAATITVFLRSVAIWPFKHVDAYWDQAELVMVEDVPEPEPEPEPDCENPAREPYERTYVLLPPGADGLWANAVIDATWDSKRWTMGGSADDAAIGCGLSRRRVIAVNPELWGGDLLAFFDEYYPGANVEYVKVLATTPAELCAALSGELPGPEPEPPEPEPGEPEPYPLRSSNFIGLHSSYVGEQSFPYITQSRTNLQKFFSAGDAYKAGKAAPGMVSIWRKYVSGIPTSTPQQEALWYVDQYTAEINAAASALGVSVYELLSYITAVEGANEVIGSNALDGLKRAVESDVAFADILHSRYGDALAPLLLNVAVGNPLESEVQYLLPAAQAAEKYNGFLGYHSYWSANSSKSFLTDNWQYHAGRWMEWDKVFVSKGCYPRYAATESGICYAWDGWSFDPAAGWRATGWAFSRYLADMSEYNRRVAEWNKLHANRCAGMTVFCYAQWNWESFLLGGVDVQSMIAWSNTLAPMSAPLAEAATQTWRWRSVDDEYDRNILDMETYLRDANYLSADWRAYLERSLAHAKHCR